MRKIVSVAFACDVDVTVRIKPASKLLTRVSGNAKEEFL